MPSQLRHLPFIIRSSQGHYPLNHPFPKQGEGEEDDADKVLNLEILLRNGSGFPTPNTFSFLVLASAQVILIVSP